MRSPSCLAATCSMLLFVLPSGCGQGKPQPTSRGIITTTPRDLSPSESTPAVALKSGPLPSEAAGALDAAVQDQYCGPNSFNAKLLREAARFHKKGTAVWVEIQLSGPPMPLFYDDRLIDASNSNSVELAEEHGLILSALRAISPAHLQVGGFGDGSGIQILNLEELVFQADEDIVLGGALVPKGAKLARQKGAWVLKATPASS